MGGQDVEHSFLKYTAQQLKFYLKNNDHFDELEAYRSTQADREYHFWERRPWQARILTREIAEQKLHYIHMNPLNAGLCTKEEEYGYSSCAYYYGGDNRWDFITHYHEAL